MHPKDGREDDSPCGKRHRVAIPKLDRPIWEFSFYGFDITPAIRPLSLPAIFVCFHFLACFVPASLSICSQYHHQLLSFLALSPWQLPRHFQIAILPKVILPNKQRVSGIDFAAQCPPKPGLPVAQYSHDFTTQGPDDSAWKAIGVGPISATQTGLGFTISKRFDAPTVASAWYFFFGRVEVHIRAAWGTGIVSAIVLESDDLDEVDWEFIGGLPNEVQTNYFGKGNTTTFDRGGRHNVQDTQYTTHNYTIDWNQQAITWYIDGQPVRTLNYQDAVGGLNFPQTPARLKLGIWAGGDPSNAEGTIQWAGGVTDYSKCPFTMYVERVSITNAHPASSYAYGDTSGSWGSIIVTPPGQGGPGVLDEEKEDKQEEKQDEKPEDK